MANIGNILTKSLGVAGLALIAYDAHNAGKIEASMNEKHAKSDNIEEHFLNDMKLDSNSTVKSLTKKGIFKYYLDENFSGFFTNIGGYFKGFTSMLVNNVIPFGLAVGTVLTKGLASKAFGVGLLAYGGIFLLQEIFGIGKSKK